MLPTPKRKVELCLYRNVTPFDDIDLLIAEELNFYNCYFLVIIAFCIHTNLHTITLHKRHQLKRLYLVTKYITLA